MKKSELVERLKRIWQYRCDGCLADTGGCSCAEDKDKMIMELINDLNVEKNEVIRGKQKTEFQ
jgi:hypothetical protein